VPFLIVESDWIATNFKTSKIALALSISNQMSTFEVSTTKLSIKILYAPGDNLQPFP
jgi:hypothetical protein